jgi:hypothetical protein
MACVQAALNGRGLARLAVAVVRLRVGVTVSALVTRATFMAATAMTCPPAVVAVAMSGAEANTHSIAVAAAGSVTLASAVTAPTITAATAISTSPAILRQSGSDIPVKAGEIHGEWRQAED